MSKEIQKTLWGLLSDSSFLKDQIKQAEQSSLDNEQLIGDLKNRLHITQALWYLLAENESN